MEEEMERRIEEVARSYRREIVLRSQVAEIMRLDRR